MALGMFSTINPRTFSAFHLSLEMIPTTLVAEEGINHRLPIVHGHLSPKKLINLVVLLSMDHNLRRIFVKWRINEEPDPFSRLNSNVCHACI